MRRPSGTRDHTRAHRENFSDRVTEFPPISDLNLSAEWHVLAHIASRKAACFYFCHPTHCLLSNVVLLFDTAAPKIRRITSACVVAFNQLRPLMSVMIRILPSYRDAPPLSPQLLVLWQESLTNHQKDSASGLQCMQHFHDMRLRKFFCPGRFRSLNMTDRLRLEG